MRLLGDEISRGVRPWREGSAIDDSKQAAFTINKGILCLRCLAVEAHLVLIDLVAVNKAQLVTNFFGAAIRSRARLASSLESVLSNLGKQGSPGATAGDEDYALGNLLRRVFFGLSR